MGNQSQKKHDAIRAAEHRAKKEAGQAAKPAETTSAHVDSPLSNDMVPATKQTKSTLQKQAPQASAPTRRSTRSKRSVFTSTSLASTPTLSQDAASTHLGDQSDTTSRPHRNTNTASARAQLLQAALENESKLEGDSDDSIELTDDDLNHIVAKTNPVALVPDTPISDGPIQLSSVGELILAAPKPVVLSHGVSKKQTKV